MVGISSLSSLFVQKVKMVFANLGHGFINRVRHFSLIKDPGYGRGVPFWAIYFSG